MLLRLLTAPVTAPVHGTLWAIDAVLRAAEEAQAQERARVLAAITDARRAHARGEIDGAELDRRIRPLLDRALASSTTGDQR